MSAQNGPTQFKIPGFVLDYSTRKGGGFGEVFKAREIIPGGPAFAVKVFNPSPFLTRDDAAERFTREIDLLRNLQHGSLVRYVCAGVSDDEHATQYIVMDYIDGETLQELSSAMSTEQKVDAILDILGGLKYLHSQSVVHRDIKPSNAIRRSSDQKIVLVDFGISYLLTELHNTDQTLTKEAIGTPGYIPFEVINDHRKSRSPMFDIYSTGVMLYQVVAGRLPEAEKYEALRDRDPTLAGLDAIVQKATASESIRYANAHSFIEELKIWQKGYRARLASPPSSLLQRLVNNLAKQDKQEQMARKRAAEQEQRVNDALRDLDAVVVPLVLSALDELVQAMEGTRHLVLSRDNLIPLKGARGIEPLCAVRNTQSNQTITFARSSIPDNPFGGVSQARQEPVVKWPEKDRLGRPISGKHNMQRLCWILHDDHPTVRGGIVVELDYNERLIIYKRPLIFSTDKPKPIAPDQSIKDYITEILAMRLGLRMS